MLAASIAVAADLLERDVRGGEKDWFVGLKKDFCWTLL